MSTKTLSITELKELCLQALVANRVSTENAREVVDALVSAEIDGQAGHGVSRIPSYVAQALSGKLDGYARPEVVFENESLVRIDAACGFAYPALSFCRKHLHEKAKKNGLAAAGIFRSHHSGQSGYHLEKLAEDGLVGILLTNSPKAIAPWKGHTPLFGTNPIAFATPRKNQQPLIIDLSLSKVARGKVVVAEQRGEKIPENWALDKQGKPTTNPSEALQGSMLPMGEEKGAALVLMVEIMASALVGGNFGFEADSFFDGEGKAPAIGQFMLALDPNVFSGGNFFQRLEELIAEIAKQDSTRLPGSKRFETRERARRYGLEIDSMLIDKITRLAESVVELEMQ